VIEKLPKVEYEIEIGGFGMSAHATDEEDEKMEQDEEESGYVMIGP